MCNEQMFWLGQGCLPGNKTTEVELLVGKKQPPKYLKQAVRYRASTHRLTRHNSKGQLSFFPFFFSFKGQGHGKIQHTNETKCKKIQKNRK